MFINKHKKDKEKFNTSLDIWEIIKPNEQGVHEDDCESYCRYLKNNISEFKDWGYYYCKLNGNGHCVLYKYGHVIDCNIRQVVSYEKYCSLFNITNFKKYNWFVVGSKIAFAKVYTWIF